MTAVSGQCRPSDESLEEHCRRLREEWVAAEHQKMSGDFQAYAGVDKVTGAIGATVLRQGSHRRHAH